MPDVRLIDANALMKRIEEVYCKDCNSHNGVMCRACAHMDDMDFIEDAPTIDAQPVKRGHWIATIDGFAPRIECSNCHISSRQNHLLAVSVDGSKLPRFCPNCGADMRGDINV